MQKMRSERWVSNLAGKWQCWLPCWLLYTHAGAGQLKLDRGHSEVPCPSMPYTNTRTHAWKASRVDLAHKFVAMEIVTI